MAIPVVVAVGDEIGDAVVTKQHFDKVKEYVDLGVEESGPCLAICPLMDPTEFVSTSGARQSPSAGHPPVCLLWDISKNCVLL